MVLEHVELNETFDTWKTKINLTIDKTNNINIGESGSDLATNGSVDKKLEILKNTVLSSSEENAIKYSIVFS